MISDLQIKNRIEGLPCGVSGTGYENCEECPDGNLCSVYVKKGLKNKGINDFDEKGNLAK